MVIRMGIIAWIVLGLIAGAIAKAITPGEQGGGWFATLILGVVGAMLGGDFVGAAHDALQPAAFAASSCIWQRRAPY